MKHYTESEIKKIYDQTQAAPEVGDLYNKLDYALGEYAFLVSWDSFLQGFRWATTLSNIE